jgi:alcohol dehydrogenase
MSHAIALEGMRLVMENLPGAYRNGADLEARAQMMAAAAMGAVAFQKGLGAIHSLSHPLGAVYGLHHGTLNAVVMPAVLRLNRPAVEERLGRAAAYLGVGGGFDDFFAAAMRLRADVGIPETLGALGVTADRVDELVAMSLADPSCGGNPVALTPENVRALFLECIG